MSRQRGVILLWVLVLLSLSMLSILFTRENGLRLLLEVREDWRMFESQQAQQNLLAQIEHEIREHRIPTDCLNQTPLITYRDVLQAKYCVRKSRERVYEVAVSPWGGPVSQISIWDRSTKTLLQSAFRSLPGTGARQSLRWITFDD